MKKNWFATPVPSVTPIEAGRNKQRSYEPLLVGGSNSTHTFGHDFANIVGIVDRGVVHINLCHLGQHTTEVTSDTQMRTDMEIA